MGGDGSVKALGREEGFGVVVGDGGGCGGSVCDLVSIVEFVFDVAPSLQSLRCAYLSCICLLAVRKAGLDNLAARGVVPSREGLDWATSEGSRQRWYVEGTV